jgi:hypothetical protein
MGLTDQIGVALSTTGQEHRLGFLETCVKAWGKALPVGSTLMVTVDGSAAEAERVKARLGDSTLVYRVGQPHWAGQRGLPFPDRLGVAVNKNTGLELLMNARVNAEFPTIEHLFLCDDDTWPLNTDALWLHTQQPALPHSMVCWGAGRLLGQWNEYAQWKWPRGVLLYANRAVLSKVGGMDEAFGLGGHEHAEWSRRIHQHGMTPVPFPSPRYYAEDAPVGRAHGAWAYWHCEDMPQLIRGRVEHSARLGARRREQTTISRKRDWDKINAVMAARDGDTSFVPFRAEANGRASATLF